MSEFERLVAGRIRRRRTGLDISQRTLADRMRHHGHNWHHTTVQRTEAGKRPLRLGELASIADALRTTVTALVDLNGADAVAVGLHGRAVRALAAELLDSMEAGEIPGSPIRYQGEEIWLHTTGQVEGWLRDRLEAS